MSFCRFSSDNWKCDFYIYEGECGYYVGVRACKSVGDIHPLDFSSPESLLDSYNKQMRSLESCKRVPIDLEYAGTSHWFDEPESVIEFVEKLVNMGYHLPGGVIESLKEEINANY